MDMATRKCLGMRCRLFAVAIFFGMSATTANAAETTIDYNFDARTINLTGETFNSTNIIRSSQASAIGLQILGANNFITNSGPILLTGKGAVGMLIGGEDNRILIAPGTVIQADGTGVLIASGRGQQLRIGGNVSSAGNAVEFGSDAENLSVDNFTLTGALTGGHHAIYIGNNAFVRNINIIGGAQLSGDIVSNLNHTSEATSYAPDRVTHLNFNTGMNYGGNISGADNIKLHVNGGTLNFSGAANVVSVSVGRGAKLFGGDFALNDMAERMAEGYSDMTTGLFINHGTIGAGSPNTNLVINGNLISDGVLQRVSGGKAGMIVVNGAANVEGSTVTTDSLLPNETATVLVADSIAGNITNPTGKPVPISAMLNATGKIVGNKLTVTTHEADNMRGLDSREEETFGAMRNMYNGLDEKRQDEMRGFYNLEPAAAKRTLTEIGSNDAAQIMSVAQQSTAVDKFISERIGRVLAPDYIDVNVRPMNFSDEDSDAPEVSVKVPVEHENNFWLNFMKNWGSLRGGTDYHGSVIVGGYDRPFGEKWRAGFFATYGTIGYGAESSRATVYDTRLGLYAGYHNRASSVYCYVNGGRLRNSLHRGLSMLGLATNANYNSRIIEIGGEYKYELQPNRTWHVSPFVNFQTSHLRQSSYNEQGAGVYNQHVAANKNTYFAAQVGFDVKRYYRTGMVGMRLGVKHGFTGADPELRISYEGDGERNYRLRQKRDKTHFVFSLRGENEFARGWFFGGETELQLGANDRDVTASLMLRRTW